jgi:excisionase family DNA binding protein
MADVAQSPDETLLDAQAVARWLGIAVTTVYDQASRGVLPHVRLWKGRRRTLLRFRRAEIEAFLIDRTAPRPGAGNE